LTAAKKVIKTFLMIRNNKSNVNALHSGRQISIGSRSSDTPFSCHFLKHQVLVSLYP
jgi:hypothetical protein